MMIRLVIVDDHPLVREAWKLMLSRDERISVVATCGDGMEAVRIARELDPDIMLMDINMEPVNGIEATRAIRQFSDSIRIIGVSVHTDFLYVSKIREAGANGYVTKNSSGQEMIEAIVRIANGEEYICNEILNS